MINICKWLIIGLAVLSAQACTSEPPAASKESADKQVDTEVSVSPRAASGVLDPADSTYLIDGETVVLNRGAGLLSPASGKALGAERIRVLGGPWSKDLDEDGDEDAILLFDLQSADKGSRYYLGAALQSGGRFVGGNSLFLGGNISQPTIVLNEGMVAASYYYRAGMFSNTQMVARTVRARWNGMRFELL